MRGLPLWIILLVGVLSGLLIALGWHDRHEAGYIPFALGIFFGLFTLLSLGAAMGEVVKGGSTES
jgi:hypothetical protein